MSMLTSKMICLISQVASIVKAEHSGVDSTITFRGMSYLLTGDFHQFPPVGKINHSLFSFKPPSLCCEIGHHIFMQFKTVVNLIQQMHVTDKVWEKIISRAQQGQCTSDDLQVICQLVLVNPKCDIPNFAEPPWSNALLITPHNSVRSQ